MKVNLPNCSAIPYYLPYVVPCLLFFGYHHSNPWMAFLPTLFVFAVVPIADALSGLILGGLALGNEINGSATKQQLQELENQYSFRIALYLWVPLQQSFLFWTASKMHHEQSWIRACGLVFSMGMISAGGMNCAHELLHKTSRIEQISGKLILSSAFYGHFYVEHTKGHHKRVATWDDPATARLGESIYQFLPRTLVGSCKSAWKLERERLKTAGCRIWGVRNQLLWYHLVSVGYVGAITMLYGASGVAFFVTQAAVAILLLEQINAIEHYGLERKLLSNGSHEPVGPQHSWDAPQTVSGYLLFKLQRHADHHLSRLSTHFLSFCWNLWRYLEETDLLLCILTDLNITDSSRRYQALQLSPKSPRLPAGYTALIPLLFIPPIWRAVMDPRVRRHREFLTRSRG